MITIDTGAFADAIKAATDQIAETVSESSLRAAAFAGAEIFRDEAIRNAAKHRKTGVLEKNIIVKRLEEESNGGERQAYLVTVRTGKFGADGDAFYWRFVAGGHKFVPRNKKISKKTGKKIGWKAHRAAAELEYGTASAPAYPFIRPAFDSKKKEATAAVNAKLAEKAGGT
ncbi:HK97-gp10 family putative phage morphogenesis protein [Massilia mucilaginosa]|nr:HK97-gp10 family putative phage morphogenesis protein [Massilia mucilaginosa]